MQNLVVRVIRGRRRLQMGKRSILTRHMLNLCEFHLLGDRLLHRRGPFLVVPNGDIIIRSCHYVMILSHWVEEATVNYFLGTVLGCGELCHGRIAVSDQVRAALVRRVWELLAHAK